MTTVAFLAETPGSATIEAQKAHVGPEDFVVLAGNRSFSQLGNLLAQSGTPLQEGDRIKIYDLNCLALSTDMLVRSMTKLLGKGISIEVVKPGFVIEANETIGQILLAALDGHYRHMHGVKIHSDPVPRGRQPAIKPDQIPAIRARMAEPGMTAAAVAREFGIGRSTLFGYLERFDRENGFGRTDEVEKRGSKDAGDQDHIPEGDLGQSTV